MTQRSRILLTSVSALLALAVLVIVVLSWRLQASERTRQPAATLVEAQSSTSLEASTDNSATRIHAHNLLLRKGPDFRVYVRWLNGFLERTHRGVNPSFDRSDSFDLDIRTGIIRVNIGDLGTYLNSSLGDSPLRNVKLVADGPNLKLTGTVRKVIPLPVQLLVSVSATNDNRVRLHILKLDLLKVPVKGLLHLFRVTPADLMKTNVQGMEVQGSDILLDTHILLPPPHIRGQLARVFVDSPDIEAVYGKAEQDVDKVDLWRNYFSLKGGTINFGKISMNAVDIVMIDISKDAWFDLDLVNYRDQFASGYTRMTSDSGLQLFIPDRRDVPVKPAQNDDIQWFKNRNIPPPPQIVASTRR